MGINSLYSAIFTDFHRIDLGNRELHCIENKSADIQEMHLTPTGSIH